MTKMKKALIGTAAAAAMAVSATPAVANDRYDNDGISAGEVIAGALVIGGIAAIAAAATSKNDDRYDRRGRDRYDRDDRYDRNNRGNDRYNYDRAGYSNNYRINSRTAVDQCVRAVERHLRRAGRANVTQIRDVDRTRYGYRVKGNVVLETRYNDDRGRFTCTASGRGNPSLQFSGLFRGR